MKRTALFSLNNTTDADRFAEQLIKAGWDIIASRETVDLLRMKGLPVQDIADFTGVKENYGFPPTMHAKVEYAATADGQPRIDLVYVIPYPLSKGNDVGGRTLLALAVKGGRIAVMDVADMKKVVSTIVGSGDVPESMRKELADKACFEIARHYAALAADSGKYGVLAGRLAYPLLNGENPYQVPAAAFVSDGENDALSLLNFRRVSGEAPCFTNAADADCILKTLCLASEAFVRNTGSLPFLCVAAKHGNACGIGVSTSSPAQAVEKALFGNPRSIWGGEVITNFPIDGQLSELFIRSERRERILGDGTWMLDVVMAPSFTQEAVSAMGKRHGRKLLENHALLAPSLKKTGFEHRMVRGGFLRQPPATYVLDLQACQGEKRNLTEHETASLIVAWVAVFSSNHGGNETALAKDGALLGVGGGPSTVEAAKVAVERAKECGHDTRGAAFAADAFFPFTDAPAVLCDAGVAIGCVPGGGKRESEIRDLFHHRGTAVAYIPEEFRGFCRH